MKQNLLFLEEMRPDFEKFSEFLLKWQKSLNLISPNSIPDLWNRHIVDSAQLYPLIPAHARVLLDMGSGAGFPALILALINQKQNGSLEKIILVESDTKKCIFLTEVARVFNLPVVVLNRRMESLTLDDLNHQPIDVLTARALAPISELLDLSAGVRTPETTCLFLKGEQAVAELEEVKNPADWNVHLIPSVSDKKGMIVQMRGVLK